MLTALCILIPALLCAAGLTYFLGFPGFFAGVILSWIGLFLSADAYFTIPEQWGMPALFLGWIPGAIWCAIFLTARIIAKDRRAKKAPAPK